MQGALKFTVDLLKNLANSKSPFGVVTCHLDVVRKPGQNRSMKHRRCWTSLERRRHLTAAFWHGPRTNAIVPKQPKLDGRADGKTIIHGFGDARGDAQRIAVDDLDEILATPRVLAIGIFQACQQRRR
ncbi:hypothetical protein I6F34_26185 [Bradyrhizobium sp. BRP05]|nr:hypothetical protein [Bradyrhizobium sp. BRP05]